MRFVGRVVAMSRKEILHIARDRLVIYLALGMPVLLLVLFGYAITFDVEELPLAVSDADRTPASRRLVDALGATGVFRPRGDLLDPALAERELRRGKVKVALSIPRGFQRDRKRGGAAASQLLVDGADNTTAQLAISYAAGVAQSESQRALAAAGASAQAPLQAKVRVRFNPQMTSARFIVPGLIPMVVATISVLLTALAVAREWERGSMEQLFATPVGSLEVILGKLLPYLGIGMVQVLLLLALGTWLFDVPLVGSLRWVALASLLFLAGMLAQGLVISVITKSQLVAAQVAAVSTMLPAMLLSGFMFPIDNMPAVLQAISHAVPARYFIDALRKVMLKGGGFDEVRSDLVALAAFALVMIALATARFRRRVA